MGLNLNLNLFRLWFEQVRNLFKRDVARLENLKTLYGDAPDKQVCLGGSIDLLALQNLCMLARTIDEIRNGSVYASSIRKNSFGGGCLEAR